MAPVFARRANEFAALVEGTSADGRDRYARLLDVVGQLQAVPDRAPRPEFVAELRSRLLAEADTVLVPAAARRDAETVRRLSLREPTRSTRDRRVATGLGTLALLGAAASVAIGSQVALPGDTLYPVKRAIEDVRTTMAVGDTETGEILLAHATERLEETEGLTRRPEVDVPATETGLGDFTDQAEDAAGHLLTAYEDTGDEQTIVELRDFTGASMDRLVALEAALPPGARDELYAAAEAVVAIDDNAVATCPSCGGAGVDDVPLDLSSSAPQVSPDLGEDPTGGGSGDNQGEGPKAPAVPLPTIAQEPTALPTLPTLPVPTPSQTPTRLPTASATLPTASTTLPIPLPTVLPTALPTLLPTEITTLLPTELTTLLPTELTTLLPLAQDDADVGGTTVSPLP